MESHGWKGNVYGLSGIIPLIWNNKVKIIIVIRGRGKEERKEERAIVKAEPEGE